MPTETMTPPPAPPTLQPYKAAPEKSIWQAKPAPVQDVGPLRPLYLSPSSVKAYLACPLNYFFDRVVGLREKTSVALHIGKAIHATLQAFNTARWRGTDSSEDAMQEAFSRHFLKLEQLEGPIDYEDEAARTKARETAWNTVRAYFTSPEAARDSGTPLGVEVELSTYIPGLPVPVKGTIDLVQSDYTAVDYKSASSKPNPEHAAFEHELQLVTYQMMIEQATGRTPAALDLVYLLKTKTPQIIRVSKAPADEKRIRRVQDMYKVAYEGITNERFHPQPGRQCSWCPFRKECSGWCR